MPPPLISVIVPARDRGAFLMEALLSIHLQTWPSVEILLVDDASEAALSPFVEAAAAAAPNPRPLRMIRQDSRRGANVARNTGIREAKGEYVQFLDSDDLLHPGKLERQVRLLGEHPEWDAVASQDLVFHQVPGDSDVLWNRVPLGDDERDALDHFLCDDPLWQTGSPLWRSASLARVGPWEEKLISWQDWEFHVRALAKGLNIHHETEVGQYLREHDHGRSVDWVSRGAREDGKLLAGKLVEKVMTMEKRWSPVRHRGMAAYYFDKTLELNLREYRRWMVRYVLAAMRNARTPAQVLLCMHLLLVLAFRKVFLSFGPRPFRDLVEPGLDRVGLRPPPSGWKRHRLHGHAVSPTWWSAFQSLRG